HHGTLNEKTWKAAASELWDQGYGAALTRLELTDSGNAERIYLVNGSKMRYCHEFKKWLIWNGQKWEIDKQGRASMLAEDAMHWFSRQAEQQLKNLGTPATAEEKERHKQAMKVYGYARTSRNQSPLVKMLERAQGRLPISADSLDTHHLKVYFTNG